MVCVLGHSHSRLIIVSYLIMFMCGLEHGQSHLFRVCGLEHVYSDCRE